MLVARLILQMWRETTHVVFLRLLVFHWRRTHIVVIIIVHAALAIEVGRSLMFVRHTILLGD